MKKLRVKSKAIRRQWFFHQLATPKQEEKKAAS